MAKPKTKIKVNQDLFQKFEQEVISDESNNKSFKKLKDFAGDKLANRKEWELLEKEQKYGHKTKMFNMVLCMTWITYIAVLLIVVFQVFHLKPIDRWEDFFLLRWIEVELLSNEKLAIVLSGFLAELLLLPKIILKGLFENKD